jgi:thiol:disulfide interchange protein
MPKRKSGRRRQKPSRLPQLLILAGVILFAVIVLAFKQAKAPASISSITTGDPPEVQLDRALQSGQPTLAFFHSNNCYQCIEMIKIVAQVYPPFSGSIALVDVNVYDERNEALLQRVSLRYIPTLIFYDRLGKGQVHVGVMAAGELEQALATLAGQE